jgi:hypothetical protein
MDTSLDDSTPCNRSKAFTAFNGLS